MPDPVPNEPSFRSITFDKLGSTNQEGLDRARRGDRGRLWIRALAQTQGRGRIGRTWSSPPGNLYASLLLVDPSEPRCAPQIGFVAGVALARAVRRLPGADHDLRLKWPNDLVHRGAKLAGILIEGCRRPDGALACVIGFGVNCVSHPVGLDYPTTDIGEVTGLPPSADDLGKILAIEMADAISLWNRGQGFASLREAWLGLALEKGTPLTVKTSSATTFGWFDTIDEAGRLRLRTDLGVVTIEAADVFAGAADAVPAHS